MDVKNYDDGVRVMRPDEQEAIRMSYRMLVLNVQVYNIQPYLVQYGDLTMQDCEVIASKQTAQDKMESLLMILMNSDRPHVFDHLVLAVEEDYSYIAEKLKNSRTNIRRRDRPLRRQVARETANSPVEHVDGGGSSSCDCGNINPGMMVPPIRETTPHGYPGQQQSPSKPPPSLPVVSNTGYTIGYPSLPNFTTPLYVPQHSLDVLPEPVTPSGMPRSPLLPPHPLSAFHRFSYDEATARRSLNPSFEGIPFGAPTFYGHTYPYGSSPALYSPYPTAYGAHGDRRYSMTEISGTFQQPPSGLPPPYARSPNTNYPPNHGFDDVYSHKGQIASSATPSATSPTWKTGKVPSRKSSEDSVNELRLENLILDDEKCDEKGAIGPESLEEVRDEVGALPQELANKSKSCLAPTRSVLAGDLVTAPVVEPPITTDDEEEEADRLVAPSSGEGPGSAGGDSPHAETPVAVIAPRRVNRSVYAGGEPGQRFYAAHETTHPLLENERFVFVEKEADRKFGFSIHSAAHGGFQISYLDPSGKSSMEGHLSHGDVILCINGLDASSLHMTQACKLIEDTPIQLILKVKYQGETWLKTETALLRVRKNELLGFKFVHGKDRPRFPGDTSFYVTKVLKHTSAWCSQVTIGDVMVAIDGESIMQLSYEDVQRKLKFICETRETVILTIHRAVYTSPAL